MVWVHKLVKRRRKKRIHEEAAPTPQSESVNVFNNVSQLQHHNGKHRMCTISGLCVLQCLCAHINDKVT